MEHKYYLPRTDTGKVIWLVTFANALGIYATALGLTPGQVAAVLADAGYFAEVIPLLAAFKDYLKTIATYKDQLCNGSPTPIGGFPTAPATPISTAVTAGIFARTTELVRHIKSNPAYNQTMGEALGIIGEEINPDFDTIQPQPKVAHKNGHAYVKWTHQGTEAADVYADNDDGGGFKLVARITTTHYLDPHLPAAGSSKIYKYKLRYVVNDEQVGEESAPVSITVTGV